MNTDKRYFSFIAYFTIHFADAPETFMGATKESHTFGVITHRNLAQSDMKSQAKSYIKKLHKDRGIAALGITVGPPVKQTKEEFKLFWMGQSRETITEEIIKEPSSKYPPKPDNEPPYGEICRAKVNGRWVPMIGTGRANAFMYDPNMRLGKATEIMNQLGQHKDITNDNLYAYGPIAKNQLPSLGPHLKWYAACINEFLRNEPFLREDRGVVANSQRADAIELIEKLQEAAEIAKRLGQYADAVYNEDELE